MATDINFSSALAWHKAHIEDRQVRGQLNDATVVVSWENIALGATSSAEDWLKTNRSETTDLQGDHQEISGTYRLVSTRSVRSRVFATYALDHDVSIDWTNARILGGSEHATDDTFLVVRFPSVNVDDASTLMAAAKGQTFTNPTIGADQFTGTYRCLAASPTWDEESQSANVDLLIGDPEFTLTSYSDYLLPNARTIVYIWNVPKEDAQTVINGYQAEGVSVSVSHSFASDISGTVDLVVSQVSEVDATAQTITVASGCDSHTTTEYRWGLTEAELLEFVAPYEIKEVGKQKQVSISFNADTGKYNAVGTVTTLDLTTVELVTVVGVASDATRTTTYRWNMTEADVIAFANLYSEREAGKRKSVTVNRRSNLCVFDAVGVVEDEDVDVDPISLTIGQAGLTLEQKEYRWKLTRAELLSFATSYVTQESGKQKRVDVSRDNDLYNAVGVTILTSPSYATGTQETYVEREDFDFNFSVTETEKEAILAALANDDTTIGNRSVSIGRNGDDTYTVNMRLARRKEDTKTFSWTVGTQQNSLTVHVGQTPANVDAILAALDNTDVEYSIRFDRAGDGTWDVVIRASTDPGDFFSSVIGTSVEQTEYQFYFEITAAVKDQHLLALGNDSNPGSKRVSVSRVSGGKYNLSIAYTTQKSVTLSDVVTRAGVNFVETQEQGYGKALTDLPVLTQVDGKAQQLSWSRDSDGYIRYSHEERDRSAGTGQSFVLLKMPGVTWNAYDFWGQAIIPTLSTTYGRIDAALDENTNTWSGRVAELTRSASSFSGDQWDNFEHAGLHAYNYIHRTGTDGKTYAARVRIEYTVKQTQSVGDAEDFLASDGLPGSDIQLIGGDRYRVIKVTERAVWTGAAWADTGDDLEDWANADWVDVDANLP